MSFFLSFVFFFFFFFFHLVATTIYTVRPYRIYCWIISI